MKKSYISVLDRISHQITLSWPFLKWLRDPAAIHPLTTGILLLIRRGGWGAAWTGHQSVTGQTHNRDKQPLLLAFALTGKLESPINLMSMCLDSGWRLENLGKPCKHALCNYLLDRKGLTIAGSLTEILWRCMFSLGSPQSKDMQVNWHLLKVHRSVVVIQSVSPVILQ